MRGGANRGRQCCRRLCRPVRHGPVCVARRAPARGPAVPRSSGRPRRLPGPARGRLPRCRQCRDGEQRTRNPGRRCGGNAVAGAHQRGFQPGGQAGQLDPLRRTEGARQRHSHRNHHDRPGNQVPGRWRADVHQPGTGPGRGRAGHLAHQGDGRTRYRRAARSAGRPLQGRHQGPPDRLPRLDHAQHPRRGRGAAYPGQAGPDRQHAGRAPDVARLRGRHHPYLAPAGARTLRHGAGDRPHRQRQDHHACTP